MSSMPVEVALARMHANNGNYRAAGSWSGAPSTFDGVGASEMPNMLNLPRPVEGKAWWAMGKPLGKVRVQIVLAGERWPV